MTETTLDRIVAISRALGELGRLPDALALSVSSVHAATVAARVEIPEEEFLGALRGAYRAAMKREAER